MQRIGQPTTNRICCLFLSRRLLTAIDNHHAAGLLCHHAEHLQIEAGADAVTVHRQATLMKPGQQPTQGINRDQVGTAHPIADVEHAAGTSSRQSCQGGIQGGSQASGAQRGPSTQPRHGLPDRLGLHRCPISHQGSRLHIHGKQPYAVGRTKRGQQVVQDRQRLRPVGTGLACRGINQDHHIASGISRVLTRVAQRQREIGFAIGGRVPQHLDGMHRRGLRSGTQDQDNCCQIRPEGSGTGAVGPHAGTPEIERGSVIARS